MTGHGRARSVMINVPMTVYQAVVLLGAGMLGGIASTVASVASVVSYPVLLALGLPPLSANVTNTMSLVLTGAGSVLGSRPELAGQRDRVLRLGVLTEFHYVGRDYDVQCDLVLGCADGWFRGRSLVQ